jgi:hypothetical protein
MEGMADSGMEEGEIGLGIKVVITSRNYASYLMYQWDFLEQLNDEIRRVNCH